MNRLFRLALCVLLCLLALTAAQAEQKPSIEVEVAPHTARFSFTLPEQEFVLVSYSARPNDSGEMVLYAPDGRFSGECFLPGAVEETQLTITVSTLGGRQLLRQSVQTAPDPAPGAPASGLDPSVRAASSAREVTLSAESDGVHYRFTVPGRDTVLLRMRSPQESHTVKLYAQDGYVYEGVLAMPNTYPDDNVTVTMTTTSSIELYSDTLRLPFPLPAAAERAESGALSGVTVCIDPGHQRNTQVETVQLAPNFSKTATTVIGMAQGVTTHRREFVVVLEVAFRLRDLLLREGAQVVMTREDLDTFVGMLERADIPNEAGADFTIRLHLNSRNDPNAKGIEVYCPYQSSYAMEVADENTYRAMGETLLNAMKAATGTTRGSCTLTNIYVGNNWAKMPSFLIEMAYLTNPGGGSENDHRRLSAASGGGHGERHR